MVVDSPFVLVLRFQQIADQFPQRILLMTHNLLEKSKHKIRKILKNTSVG